MIPEIAAYCRPWSQCMDRLTSEQDRMAYFQEQLPALLMDRSAVGRMLANMARGLAWPNLRDQGIFVHEVLLYLDPGRRFSLRLYLHPPGSHTDIHDHSSWGISGCPAGRLSVIRYKVDRRLADDRAVLTQRDPVILSPGEVTVTRAGERGVHQTGSPDANPNVMISVYGRPGRRLYINTYDAQTGRITQRYPPKILRRKLAQQAFRAFYDSDLDA